MKDDADSVVDMDGEKRSHPEKVELEYVVRKYNVTIERAEELVAQFGNDESLIAAELALKTEKGPESDT